jgi:Trypsin-like peptidase domain/Effector-associated domain 1
MPYWIDNPSVLMTDLDLQQLQSVLCDIYYTVPKIRTVLRRIEMAEKHVLPNLPSEVSVSDIWDAALSHLRNLNKRGHLVEVVQADNPDSAYAALFDRLRRETRPPQLIRENLVVALSASTEEACLFRDDLTMTLEALRRFASTIDHILRHSRSVCRVRTLFANGLKNGTAFVVAPNKLLTAAHVVRYLGDAPTSVKVFFDDDGGAASMAEHDASIFYVHVQEDWAVLACDAIGDRTPLVARSGPVRRGDSAYLIQHPEGGIKRIGCVRNTIVEVTPSHIRYLTDTHGGSSGAPVLDDSGHVIAIHQHAGDAQTELGQAPFRANQGRCLTGLAGLANLVLFSDPSATPV